MINIVKLEYNESLGTHFFMLYRKFVISEFSYSDIQSKYMRIEKSKHLNSFLIQSSRVTTSSKDVGKKHVVSGPRIFHNVKSGPIITWIRCKRSMFTTYPPTVPWFCVLYCHLDLNHAGSRKADDPSGIRAEGEYDHIRECPTVQY